ncbi:hypothetical protein CDAR_541771 [Caerostris darwini]|uniref:Uncharacterized protein n=1 Tax=Caerostris darwini TaxID=1538125 RepID=A0AAV4UUD3_9ARAC|nr:hypothetical protein CDAR_541771 [Caerostris darwini]
MRFHGVMVSTLDFESSDPSSNLGGTLFFVRRAGVEPATYGSLFSTTYSPPLCQLSYRRMFTVSIPSSRSRTSDLWISVFNHLQSTALPTELSTGVQSEMRKL